MLAPVRFCAGPSGRKFKIQISPLHGHQTRPSPGRTHVCGAGIDKARRFDTFRMPIVEERNSLALKYFRDISKHTCYSLRFHLAKVLQYNIPHDILVNRGFGEFHLQSCSLAVSHKAMICLARIITVTTVNSMGCK